MISLRKAATSEEIELARDGKLRGVWWPIQVAGKKSAIGSCPGCPEFWSLDRWEIKADGTVHPSVDHSAPITKTDGTVIRDCLFHDHIKLEGWEA